MLVVWRVVICRLAICPPVGAVVATPVFRRVVSSRGTIFLLRLGKVPPQALHRWLACEGGPLYCDAAR